VLLAGLSAYGAGESDPAAELIELYHQRDYFVLRARLAEPSGSTGTAEYRFLTAVVDHAFNRPLEANRILVDLEPRASELPAALRSEALYLQMKNHLRLHDYGAALASAQRIIGAPGEHPSELVSEVANTALLLDALRGAPPQTVEVRSTTRLKLELHRRLAAIEIDGSRVELAIDTGANFSVLARSEAKRAGLEIREVGLQVATSTGGTVLADVAVAKRVSLGRAELRNVVFLVFPDELLSFADGSRLSGLIGFPVLEALGEIRLLADNLLEIPARAPKRTDSNLALDGPELLVSARFHKQDVVCRLDTGSSRTFFYEPFFRRFQSRIESLGARQRVEVEGVGGTREVEAIRPSTLTLTVARADLVLPEPLVYTSPLGASGREFLSCNLGVEQFDRFRYYAINFEDMALVLGPALGRPGRSLGPG
jgi:hypothetical protein